MKKFRNNNKGFTLVELIIVIAIIAILAAVAAPQYIKYVENSRKGTDENALNEYAHAAEIAMVGDGTTVPKDSSFEFSIDGTTGAAPLDGAEDTLEEAVEEIVPDGNYTFKSTAYKGKTIVVEVNATTGKGTWKIKTAS